MPSLNLITRLPADNAIDTLSAPHGSAIAGLANLLDDERLVKRLSLAKSSREFIDLISQGKA
ncbi:hypothetical protein EHW66_18930 [Erwinia psidii]|uniref:hypothetical protein n=1 Tax=Erwinia psidii TaxID=69224 RepID=UPI00226B388B|nr:hypothetical protein [Erwinia psidii]MCX8959560.1 hypothetical protein [Erwinia psidii]MCX8963187.1 hypothetical protein [Erwinia psidii]MCX8966976.1 hypothetical protein [Erwinia psidii]